MGRRLPWKKPEESPAGVSKATAQSSPAVGSARAAFIASPAAASSPFRRSRGPATPRRLNITDEDLLRSPSTSPPPEPPKEELMKDGDEHYRMVEDEFLSVAQRFTTHLHRAEYTRLRQQAASQNAAAISDIERPVVGPSTAESKRKRDAQRRQARQSSIVGGGGAATGLRGLLDSPRKSAAGITGQRRDLFTTRPGARGQDDKATVPAGSDGAATTSTIQLSQQDSTDTEASEDELPGVSTHLGPGNDRPVWSTAPAAAPSSSPTPKTTLARRAVPRDTVPVERRIADGDEDLEDDDDLFGIKRKRARREKSREKLRSRPAVKSDPDVVPSFL